MKKLISLLLVFVLALSLSAASAKTVAPDQDEFEGLAGVVVNATVGEYNEADRTFTVTLYCDDSFDIEDVERIAAGDTLLTGGHVYTVKEKTEDKDSGDIHVTAEDGTEIVFVQVGDDDMVPMSTDDDRHFMHAFAVLVLPVAADIVYEDASDPEKAEPVVTKGLEEILKIKAEKEETSIGFDYYATIIELNNNLEIVRIHQDYDVAQ